MWMPKHAVRGVGVVGHIEWAAMNAAAGYPPERVKAERFGET
jgi:hypothetical protein